MWASFEHQLVIETKMAEGCSSHRGVVLDVRIEISIMSTLYLDVVLRILGCSYVGFTANWIGYKPLEGAFPPSNGRMRIIKQ